MRRGRALAASIIGSCIGSIVGLAFVVVGLAACDRQPELSGVGPWSVTKTQRKDATGICQPTELPNGRMGVWCFKQKPFGLAKKAAAVDLFFASDAPDAPLIELQLQLRGCVEEDVEVWLRQNFGAPTEQRPGRAYYRMKKMFLAALLPQDPGRCVLRMLPLSEADEIERIKLL